MEVRCKREMYEAFLRGDFGNIVPHFKTADELEAHVALVGGDKLVGLRRMDPAMPFHPNLHWQDAVRLAQGMEPGSYMFGMGTDDSQLTLNAEVMTDERGLYVFYATTQKTMRRALAEDGRHARGLLASSVLRYYLCPSSHEDLMALMERYPDSVVELSAYRRDVGVIPNRNTVIWEVRNY